MKKSLFIGSSVLALVLLLVLAASCSANQSELRKLKEIAGPPPASLDRYFPPQAPAPVLLIEMFNLAGPFGGIGTDLQEQDTAGVKANFQAFKSQYDKVSKMVPEWTSLFPQDPVTALGKAIDSGNPAQIGPAMGKVGDVCSSCHELYIVKVQQKYHWKNSDDVKVKDPVTGQTMAWRDYMWALDGSYAGIGADLQEGQIDNARKNFQAFDARFKAMAADGCKQCHADAAGNEIPRKYFVDQSILDQVSKLGQTLAASNPDPKAAGDLIGFLGNEACLKCHWVHYPAQNTKDLWEHYKDILK